MSRHLFMIMFLVGSMVTPVDSLQAAGPEVKYKSAALRDPFIDPTDEKPINDTSKVEASIRSLPVQGVIVSGNTKSAIINGAIYKVGGKLGTAEVVDIDRDGVIILYNGKEIKLELIKRKMRNEKKAGSALAASQK